MLNIEQDILITGDLFNQISSEFSVLNDENFSSKMESINSLIGQLADKKKQLKNKLPKNDYFKYCDLVQNSIKQISGVVDNIIEEKKKNLDNISEELSKTINKKKIIKYQRY